MTYERLTMKTKTLPLLAMLLSSILVACVLSSCGVDSKDDNLTNAQDKRYSEQTQKLRTEYAEIEGKYTGAVYAPERTVPIELRLLSIETENGTDSTGRTKTLPKLKATITQMDSSDDDVIFAVSLDKDTGELIFVLDSKNSPGSASWSIIAKLSSREIIGEVRQDNAVLGKFVARFESKNTTAPTADETNQRIRKLLARAEGTFGARIQIGEKTLANGKVTPWLEDVEFSVAVTGVGKPSILVTCALGKGGSFGREVMNGSFSASPLPGTLYVQANPSNTGMRICPFLSLTGHLTPKGFDAVGNTRRGGVVNASFTRLTNPK